MGEVSVNSPQTALTGEKFMVKLLHVKQFDVQLFYYVQNDCAKYMEEIVMVGNERKQDVGRLLGMIHNGVHRRMVNSPAHREVEGMTGKNGWIIGFLSKNEGCPVYQKDLEKEFNVTRSTASKVITLMEKKGFVARRGVENDARLKEIVLTEKGRMLACKMQRDFEEMEAKLTAGFSREERELLLDFLTRIYGNLNENERNDKGGEKQ